MTNYTIYRSRGSESSAGEAKILLPFLLRRNPRAQVAESPWSGTDDARAHEGFDVAGSRRPAQARRSSFAPQAATADAMITSILMRCLAVRACGLRLPTPR
jgi:hypothetical protein